VISPAQWGQLISGLPARCSPRADWGERKQAPASVWTCVTGGEHLFAPAVMTDPAAPRSQRPGGRDRLLYVDLRWPHFAAGTRGQYRELRHRLNDYADQMAQRIDSSPSSVLQFTLATKTSWNKHSNLTTVLQFHIDGRWPDTCKMANCHAKSQM
jgi:hypothetical protein